MTCTISSVVVASFHLPLWMKQKAKNTRPSYNTTARLHPACLQEEDVQKTETADTINKHKIGKCPQKGQERTKKTEEGSKDPFVTTFLLHCRKHDGQSWYKMKLYREKSHFMTCQKRSGASTTRCEQTARAVQKRDRKRLRKRWTEGLGLSKSRAKAMASVHQSSWQTQGLLPYLFSSSYCN